MTIINRLAILLVYSCQTLELDRVLLYKLCSFTILHKYNVKGGIMPSPSPIHTHSEPQNVTLFGNRVFADVIS